MEPSVQVHADQSLTECSWCGIQCFSYGELESHIQDCHTTVIPQDVHQEEVVQQFETTNLLPDDGLIISTTNADDEETSTSLLLLPPEATNSLLGIDFDQPSAGSGLDSTTIIEVNPSLSASNPDENRCGECHKTFTNYKAKSQHERLVHAKGPVHSCSVCDRKFTNSQYLRDHMRIHSHSKPFVCDYANCGKAFRLSKDLVRHKRVHTGEKPFK